jgi:hypothetical protein
MGAALGWGTHAACSLVIGALVALWFKISLPAIGLIMGFGAEPCLDAVRRLQRPEGWDYSGINPVDGPTPMGREYAGIMEAVGSDVTTITPGQFVIGSFFASDNTCPSLTGRARQGSEEQAESRRARAPLDNDQGLATTQRHLRRGDVSGGEVSAARAECGRLCRAEPGWLMVV